MMGARRRGSIYLAATSGLVMVAGVGLAGMAMMRADRSTLDGTQDIARLRALAGSGLELAAQRMSDDAGWREEYVADPVWSWTIDGASVGVTITDPVDGDVGDDLFDDVIVTSWAERDGTRQGMRVRMRMEEAGGTLLGSTIASTGYILVDNANPVEVGSYLYTLTNFRARFGSVVDGDVAAVGSIQTSDGSTITGGTRSGISAHAFPDRGRAFDAWIARATPIDPALLPNGNELTGVRLAADSNPFGATNPEGIYWIDGPKDYRLWVRDVVIGGTLIVTNVATGMHVQGNFEAVGADGATPVLMVDGPCEFDNDMTGAARLQGVVLIDGGLDVEAPLLATGPFFVYGDVHIENVQVRIIPSGELSESVFPEGFATRSASAVVDGSWHRAVD
ncbi:MAG: hypothetical protein ACTS3F_11280 [Phycisphaerales bacterium]